MAYYWLLNNNFFDNQRPYSRINDQQFGLVLEPRDEADTLLPLMLSRVGYQQRPWRSPSSDAGSTVTMGADQFKVNLDVQQFKPEEISVKVTGDGTAITIEGKHEEKQDEHGYISRQFVRRYVLPKGHDASKVESKLSSDGVLTVTAPRMAVADAPRTVAITQTGEAFKATALTEKKHCVGEETRDEKKAVVEKKLRPEMEKAIEKKVEVGIEMLIERQAEKYVETMVCEKKMKKEEDKEEEKANDAEKKDNRSEESPEEKKDNRSEESPEEKKEKKSVEKPEEKEEKKCDKKEVMIVEKNKSAKKN